MAQRAPVNEPNDASFIYVRRHGPHGDYRGGYRKRQLERDAKQIHDGLNTGKTVYVYFNNDAEGHAIVNTRQLKALLADHA